jgi:hypothetical protein
VPLWDKEGYVTNTTILNKTGYTDFIFPVDDIKKATEEGGFGITAYERPYLDELLRMIQDEDMLIEVLDEDRFRLAQGGINRCKEMYPAMS